MLVDDQETLEQIFSKALLPIAVHCEDEQTIRDNLTLYEEKYGDDIPFRLTFDPGLREEKKRQRVAPAPISTRFFYVSCCKNFT